MKTKFLIKAFVASLIGFGMQCQAAEPSGQLPCGNLVGSGIFLTDYSGTMMQKVKLGDDEFTRVSLAKKILVQINDSLPEKAELNLGVGSIAPFSLVLRPGKHSSETLTQGLEKLPEELEFFGRKTNLGEGIKEIIKDSARHVNNRSVIGSKKDITKLMIFTDGDEINRGQELKEVLPDLKDANPNVRITWISFADSDETTQMIQTFADLSGGTIYDAMVLLQDKSQIDRFVMRELYRQCPDISFSFAADTLFAFDRSHLSDAGQQEIAQAADKINAYAAMIKEAGLSLIITAHTDRLGTESYNQKLSERRLATVVKALEANGVDMTLFSEMRAMGESQPVTGNKCDKLRGKKLIDCLQADRRVEIRLKQEDNHQTTTK